MDSDQSADWTSTLLPPIIATPDVYTMPLMRIIPIPELFDLSIESIVWDCYTTFDYEGYFDDVPGERDLDYGMNALSGRRGSMPRRVQLKLPHNDDYYFESHLQRVLQDCPALERLGIPQHFQSETGARFAQIIRKHCPLIRDWSILQSTNPSHTDHKETLDAISGLSTLQFETLYPYKWNSHRMCRSQILHRP
ncbi:hypothetical protein FBU30_009271 [Linnemannia zychae]|nr:hypothetical protein FBU30_009271 [Linnemannia zychae]